MDIRIVDGRLTKDAELRQTSDGKKYVTFSIANNSFVKNEQVTTYFNVVTFRQHDIENYEKLVKGKLVIVNGKPNEVMAVRDGNTYLNRNLLAYNIEGTYYGSKDNKENSQVSTYKDVAPFTPKATVPKPETFNKQMNDEKPYSFVNGSQPQNDDKKDGYDLPF